SRPADGERRCRGRRLFTPFRPLARLAGYRAVQLMPIMSRKGALLGTLAIALAGRAAQVGVYTYDVNKGATVISEGYAALHGLPGGTTETSYSEWRARVHPEDLGRAEALRDQAFADRRKEDDAEYRIVLPTGEIRWIERRGSIS